MELNKAIVPDETEMTVNAENDVVLNEVVVSDDEANYKPIIGMVVR